MTLLAKDREVRFPRMPLVMGILNINDDSFSGDGKLDVGWALARAREMVEEGADIIDVGAESARTNRAAIPEETEIARLNPFLECFREAVAETQPNHPDQVHPPLLSINTWRPEVAAAALEIDGDILNDMGGLPTPENAEICAATGAALLIMHTVGLPKVPHDHVSYLNVIDEIEGFFHQRMDVAHAAGVSTGQVILDPGIDFAKSAADSLSVLRHTDRLAAIGRPLLLPVSRKSVIGAILDHPDARNRDPGTIACIVAAQLRGAAILRVHHVRAARLAIQTLALIGSAVDGQSPQPAMQNGVPS